MWHLNCYWKETKIANKCDSSSSIVGLYYDKHASS
uniref:Uncharacterized protein n=1 Tax=Arundo donax TaxID=35708 RepID=A0A0A9BUX3_ARUDO